MLQGKMETFLKSSGGVEIGVICYIYFLELPVFDLMLLATVMQ